MNRVPAGLEISSLESYIVCHNLVFRTLEKCARPITLGAIGAGVTFTSPKLWVTFLWLNIVYNFSIRSDCYMKLGSSFFLWSPSEQQLFHFPPSILITFVCLAQLILPSILQYSLPKVNETVHSNLLTFASMGPSTWIIFSVTKNRTCFIEQMRFECFS